MIKSKHLALLTLSGLFAMFLTSCGDDTNEVTPQITADFSSTVTSTSAGESITFSDNSEGNINSWSWEFEGGTPSTSSSANPSVVYAKEGTYQVKLTISDGNQSKELVQDNFITISHAVPSGLAARYSFSNHVKDAGTNALDGSIVQPLNSSTGPIFTTDRFGTANQAIEFRGSGGVIVADNASLDFTTDFSASFWMKQNKLSKRQWRTFFSKGGSGNESYAFFAHSSDYYHPVVNVDAGRKHLNTTNQTELFSDSWVHVVVTFEDGVIKIYQNNLLIHTGDIDATNANTTLVTNNSELHIGHRNQGDGFIGSMDELRFYNRTLSTDDINKIYQSEK